MKVLELFAGTRSIGKAFEARGHQVFSIDWGDFDRIDLRADISTLSADVVLSRFGRPDVIWAQTGTQGVNGKDRKKYRAVIPPALCEYVVDLCEKALDVAPEKR